MMNISNITDRKVLETMKEENINKQIDNCEIKDNVVNLTGMSGFVAMGALGVSQTMTELAMDELARAVILLAAGFFLIIVGVGIAVSAKMGFVAMSVLGASQAMAELATAVTLLAFGFFLVIKGIVSYRKNCCSE